MKHLFAQRSSRLLGGLVLISLFLTLAQSGPLNGSLAALLLVVLLQVYLPGVLLARLRGKLGSGPPLSRLAWVLVGGSEPDDCPGRRGAPVQPAGYQPNLIVSCTSIMLGLAALPSGQAVGDNLALVTAASCPLLPAGHFLQRHPRRHQLCQPLPFFTVLRIRSFLSRT